MTRWNHNIHYHPVVLDAVPAGAQRALDVGCGEGGLTRELRAVVPHVTGVDLHAPGIELARQQDPDGQIDYRVGDFLTADLEPASFDVVASVATLHHVNARAGLARMAELVRPGGRLAVIGLARADLPQDIPRVIAAIVGTRVLQLTRTLWHHPSPMVWPPAETYSGMRRIAAELLPGVRYRRHLLLRYSLVWTRP